LNENLRRFYPLLILLLAFLAGCLFTGLLICGQRSGSIGELDSRYTLEHSRATEIIGRLEEELGRERELNRELREHNIRARELAQGLTGTSERNVRNLQDAVSLIQEVRDKLKILADFYANSDSGNSGS